MLNFSKIIDTHVTNTEECTVKISEENVENYMWNSVPFQGVVKIKGPVLVCICLFGIVNRNVDIER